MQVMLLRSPLSLNVLLVTAFQLAHAVSRTNPVLGGPGLMEVVGPPEWVLTYE